MSRKEEIIESVLPRLAASGKLGEDVRFVKCHFDETAKGEAHFASSVCFLVSQFRTDRGLQEEPLLVKYNIADEMVRKWLNLDDQFRNEITVYEKCFPFLERDGIIEDIFPKYFLSSLESEGSGNYYIILEDLRSSGYRLSTEILDLDFEHCALAFKRLGAFHALSFAAKQNNATRFYEITKDLRRNSFDYSRDDYLFKGSVGRAAKPLLDKGINVEKIKQLIDKLQNPAEYFDNIFKVKEPMGVLVHGDFCRNNVLFKYDQGKPVDIKCFDVAHSKYTSPMIDFSFFFLLNCSEQSRRLHRERFLEIYHGALTSSLPDVEVPPLEDFREEFRLKAVYGFLHCSFFKPKMISGIPFVPELNLKMTYEQRAGEEGTRVITNMLSELIDLKCVW